MTLNAALADERFDGARTCNTNVLKVLFMVSTRRRKMTGASGTRRRRTRQAIIEFEGLN
jgi:hypothetical protein